jgi:hypothetical protein
MISKKIIKIYHDEKGNFISTVSKERSDLDNNLKWDSPGVMKVLRKKLREAK